MTNPNATYNATLAVNLAMVAVIIALVGTGIMPPIAYMLAGVNLTVAAIMVWERVYQHIETRRLEREIAALENLWGKQMPLFYDWANETGDNRK